MNQPILTNSDISNLYHIVEQANRNYLKQSRVNDKPAFNILRVLSALRLLFPESPSALYNAVIFITKNYDPQTYYHWKKAVEDINRNRNMVFKSKNNYCRPEIATYTKTYQNSFNRSRINESCEHLQSKSYAQINIPQEMNSSHQESFYGEDQKEPSQTNAETGKRQFYTKADSVSHVSKNHYISFEPYRKSTDKYLHNYDKENINSTNVEQSRKKESSYQYIEAIQRDLIRTAKQSIKTPIDQSFIKNINSSESPYIYSKLQQECHDPIEEQMTARANTFYHFNLQLKVISSLQANSYVFQKAKENELKAQMERRSKLLHKSFLILGNNVKIQQQKRRKEEKAVTFYNKNVYSKVYNVLRLVFDLRNNTLLQTTRDITKMNRVSFQFILGLLFTLHNTKQQEKQNFIDFQSKIVELIHSDSANKLFLIVKYFGKHAWITEENIQKLIDQYKLTICKQVFKTLKQQREVNNRFDDIRALNLKRQSFYALKVRWNKFACYKKKIEAANNKRNRSLLEKVMKSFLETVYSTKLYSKRCQYIQRKKLFHLKGKVCKIWIEEARKKLTKRKEMTNKGGIILAKMQSFIKRFVFVKINEKVQEVDNKVAMIISNNLNNRKASFFHSLRAQLDKQLKLKQADKLIEKLQCRLAVSKWKESTKKGKAISKMILNIKIHYFRSIVLPHINESIQIVKEMQSNEMSLLRRMFEEMKRLAIEQLIKRQGCILQIQNKVNALKKRSVIGQIRQNWQYEKQIKKRANLRKKTSQLLTFKKKIQNQLFIYKFYSFYNQSIEAKQTNAFLTSTLKAISSKRFIQRLQEQHSLRNNYTKLLERVSKTKAKQASVCFQRTIRASKTDRVRKLRKNRFSHEMSMILKQMYSQECEKKQLSSQFYDKQLKKKVLIGFCMLVEQFKQVQELAHQFILRNTLQSIKQSLIYNAKEQKVKAMHKIYKKKIAFDLLAQENHELMQSNTLISLRFRNMGTLFIKNLRENVHSKHYKEINEKKLVQLQKAKIISRLRSFYIHKIIENKHLYMALKFRAVKLCLIAFSALSSFQSKKLQKKSIIFAYKGIAQRLSTDIIG